MDHPTHWNKRNLFVFSLVLFCLLEAIQMVDFSQSIIPSFRYDPFNKFDVLRRDFFCAKTELKKNNVDEVYFLADGSLAERDLMFESFYASYILAPEILLTKNTNSLFVLTLVEPENTEKLLQKYPFEITQSCGNTRVLVLKRK